MAVNPLSLAESLRPWRTSGITHFLRDVLGESDEGVVDPERPESVESKMRLADSWTPGSGVPLDTALRDEGRNGWPDERSAPGPGGKTRGFHDSGGGSGRDTAGDPGRAGQSRPPWIERQSPAVAVDPGLWPESWQALLARTRSAPILWSYPELGLDLSGRGSSERSACLREIIGKLQLPKGTSTFWPMPAPEADESGVCEGPPRGSLFAEGVRLLQPSVIVLLGIRAVELSGLELTLRTPFTQQILRGMLFVLLPDFSALLSNGSLPDKSCVFLRTALAGIPALSSDGKR